MKMLRELPKLLRFIPGTAQDLRAYFLTLSYWLAGSADNLANMVALLVNRYAAGPRKALAGTLKVAPPIEYPDCGLYHPRAKDRVTEDLATLPRPGTRGTVGLLLLRAYVLANNARHYDGMIASLEAQGLNVVPAFASGLDARPAMERFFMRDGVPQVDAVVSLTGFSLVGGPAYNDAHAAEEALAALDVPYVTAHPLEFQTMRQWSADKRGLLPVEATMMVAIPELDGGVWPMTFGGRCGASDQPAERCAGCDGVNCARDMVPHPERAAMLAARVAKLVALRRSERATRKVATVLFNFPPNAGTTGTAAYLGVFASLLNTLRAMREAGYTVEVPDSVDALREMVINGNRERHGTTANVAARISADDQLRRTPWLAEIEAAWGPAPGRQLTDGRDIFVLGVQLGNVFVGVQPGMGYEGDPMRLLFEHGFAPTHAFVAFYRWLREDFGAHAVLHFGTHGALEFMPGKQAGMSGQCWPDRLIGDLPNFYLYASNNPSEGMIAKRRAGATLVSYLTPPVASAGLYRGLLDLKASIDRWRGLEPDADIGQRAALSGLIQAQATEVNLATAEPVWGDTATAEIDRLGRALLELEYTLIPHGLHVVGEPPNPEQRAEMLDAAGVTRRGGAREVRCAARHRLRASGDPARARWPLYPAGAGRRPAAQHGRAADGAEPARLRPLQAAQRLRGAGRRPPGAAAARPPRGGRQRAAGDGGDGALGHRQPEDRGRADRPGAGADGRGAALRQLRAPGRGGAAAAGRARPAADRRGGDAVRHLPRPAAAADEAAGGSRAAGRLGRRAGRAEFPPRPCAGACRPARRQHRAGGAAGLLQRRRHLWRERQRAGRRGRLERRGRARRGLRQAQGLRLWRGRQAGAVGRGAERVLATVEVTYQNLDSIEVGVTTVDHYFDTLGGISRAVRRARGGVASAVYIGDQTRGDGVVRTIAEQVTLETRTRALNPKWYEALLKHGFEGVREIEAHVTNTMGWSATTGDVAPWVYEKLAETFVLDPEMRDRMAKLNPTASAKIANRLIEAQERNYWSPDASVLDRLRRAGEELEDRLEGVAAA